MAKQNLNNIGLGIIVIIGILFIAGNVGKIIMSKNQHDFANSLEGMVFEINQHLPRKAQDGFDNFIMNKIKLEDSSVVWEATLDTTFFYPTNDSFLPESLNGGILPIGSRDMPLDLDTMLSKEFLNKSQKLNLLYYNLFAKTEKPNPLYEEIMRHKYSQTWRYSSPFSDRKIEFTMTYDEMKETEDFCKLQPQAALEHFLTEYIKRQNRLLALASGNADIRMRMYDEKNDIVCRCVLDKSYSRHGNRPISELRSLKEDVQVALAEDTQTLPIFYDIKSICEKSGKHLLFRFMDNNKTDSIEFTLY